MYNNRGVCPLARHWYYVEAVARRQTNKFQAWLDAVDVK